MAFKPFKHQEKSQPIMDSVKTLFDTSDCGTGKTLNHIYWYDRQQKKSKGKFGSLLVICTKSIMEAAWAADITAHFPHLRYSLAFAENRAKAFEQPAEIYIVNHDGVNWLAEQKPSFFKRFNVLVVDESSAFKHHTSQRSKNLAKIVKHFEWRRLLTGTPMSRSVTDLWHQAMLLDGGRRLGSSFFAFRNAMCDAGEQKTANPHARSWTDREHAYEACMDLLKDITLRWELDECHDIPKNVERAVQYRMSKKLYAAYAQLQEKARLELTSGKKVSAAHAAVLRQKLLQVASGAVYAEDGSHAVIDDSRYELTVDLATEAPQSVVFFWWTHQRDELVKVCEKRKLRYAVFDGSTKPEARKQITKDFQAGKLDIILAHPQSAGHGLTWTKGTITVFASPHDNAELILQALHRIYRAGQKFKTQTIFVLAEGTIDEVVYENTKAKVGRQDSALTMMKRLFGEKV